MLFPKSWIPDLNSGTTEAEVALSASVELLGNRSSCFCSWPQVGERIFPGDRGPGTQVGKICVPEERESCSVPVETPSFLSFLGLGTEVRGEQV